MFDAHPNLAQSTIASPLANPLTDTSIALGAGDGAFFAANMPVTLAPADQDVTYLTAEIGYVTAVVGDTLTVLRAQEGTTAKSIQPGWRVIGSLTQKTLNDIEDAFDDKADAVHTHAQSDVIGLATSLAGKSNTGHIHTSSDVTNFTTAVSSNSDVAANTAARHTHSNGAVLDATTASFTTDDETKLDGIATGATQNSSDASLRDRTTHTGAQAISTVTGLQTALDGKQATGDYATNTALTSGLSGKANTSHAHVIADTTGLQTELDGKAATSHTHTASQVSDSTTVGRAVLTAVDAAAARTAIGAGTSSLVIGTTGSTAKAGDYTPTKSDVGLANADNTSDVDKPVSTATQTALDGKAATSHSHAQADVTGLVTALSGKEPTISAGTTAQYFRGDKSFQTLDKTAVGLPNVDNTSDATKNAASVTLTNKTINGSNNTLSNIPQSAVTSLVADLSGKAPTSHTHTLSQISNFTIGTTPPGSPSVGDLWLDTN